MTQQENLQYFNHQNSLYVIIYNYVVLKGIKFKDTTPARLSKKEVRRYIEMFGVVYNLSKVFNPTIKVASNDKIEIDEFKINFICFENKTFDDHEKAIKNSIKEELADEGTNNVIGGDEVPGIGDDVADINQFIEIYFQSVFEVTTISDVSHNESKKAFAHVLSIFEKKGFEALKTSKYSYELTDFLKQKVIQSGLLKELQLMKAQVNFSGKLIETLIDAKHTKDEELHQLYENLTTKVYSKNYYKFLQEYSRITSSLVFQYTLQPIFNPHLCSKVAIENLLKPVNDSKLIVDSIEKYSHFEGNKETYEKYLEFSNADGAFNDNKYFHNIATFLFEELKQNCEATEEKIANLTAEATTRKYNFSNLKRDTQDLFFYINNVGQGLANNVKLTSLSPSFIFNKEYIGLLKPGERREIIVNSKIIYSEVFVPQIEVSIEWEKISGTKDKKEFKVTFEQQDGDIPWEELRKQKPYSISEIEDEKKLYGRADILEELKSNILSNNIESYKLWGQKRVGKSSIVKTVKNILYEEEKIMVVYKAVGGLRNASNPIMTLNDMGASLCSELLEEIDLKIKDPSARERLRGVEVPSFNGSFNPLESFIKNLFRIDSSLKFVFILDEYDRLNDEFFLPGNLGETLSSSIGKSLNSSKHIGFILVGSENMQLLDRQGINYNSFHEKEVDTFDKTSEYSSFKKIVTGPSYPFLNYSDRAIERIYEESNGNPYFANLICANAFNNAYKNQDSHINQHAINQAIETIVNSSQKSHFEHFWGDGITEETSAKKERKTDIRRRVLVSFSMSFQQNHLIFPTRTDILKNFKFPEEYRVEKYEVENTIVEFFNRKIFWEEGKNVIRIHPLLFENWLCGPGKTLMIQGVSDLEALHREKELEQEFTLKNDELERLSESLVYQGQKIAIEKFQKYFYQFGNPSEQRKVFKLLDRILYISQEEINEFFRKEQKNIFSNKQLEIKSSVHTIKREGVEIYSFSDNQSENEVISESFKRMSRIRSNRILKNIKTESLAWKKIDASEIIIIESVVDDIAIFSEELSAFLTGEIFESKLQVRIVILVITSKAKMNLVKLIASFSNVRLIILKEVEDKIIKPFIEDTQLFENKDEANQSFSIVRKFFPSVERKSLLVLLEPLCPSRSIPILWCENARFKPIFPNIHVEIKHVDEEEEKEKLRTRLYHANTVLSQKLNVYIVDKLKEKAKLEGKDDWFRVEYIPKSVLGLVLGKWVQEGQVSPRESYFDFLDYKKIIELNSELTKVLNLPGEGLSWCDKLNVLRRDPAHPEKPAPSIDEVEYFEKMKEIILSRLP